MLTSSQSPFPAEPRSTESSRLGAPSRPTAQRLTLLDALPGVAEAVDSEAHDVLRRALLRRTLHLEEGPWDARSVTSAANDAFGVVVLDGVLLRDSSLGGRHHTEIFGPGDVMTPWTEATSLVPLQVAWRAVAPSSLGILDSVFLTASRRWPELGAVLTERHGETCARLGVHMSICQLPRVADRVSYMLWHAAERLGRVTPDGIVVPLRLTHEELGHLIGARRSTVTLALGALADSGALERRRDGSFVLHGEPPAAEGLSSWPPRQMEARQSRRAPRSPDVDGLRRQLEAVQPRTRELVARVAAEHERAREWRKRSHRLRERVRRDRAAATELRRGKPLLQDAAPTTVAPPPAPAG